MSSIENRFREHQEDEYAEFLEFKEKKMREKGILPDGSPLGDSVHRDTIKSYAKLRLPVPDTVRLATLRPHERMKRIVLELKGRLDIQTTITKVCRLKDKGTGKEFIVWDRHEQIKDMNDNTRSADYSYCGTHQKVEGIVHRNAAGEITNSEVTEYHTTFEKEFSKKSFEEVMKQRNGEGNTEYVIAYTKNKGKNAVVSKQDKQYAIKCAQDFVNGKFEELWELGARALGDTTPMSC